MVVAKLYGLSLPGLIILLGKPSLKGANIARSKHFITSPVMEERLSLTKFLYLSTMA
jgi:hypothetical protein